MNNYTYKRYPERKTCKNSCFAEEGYEYNDGRSQYFICKECFEIENNNSRSARPSSSQSRIRDIFGRIERERQEAEQRRQREEERQRQEAAEQARRREEERIRQEAERARQREEARRREEERIGQERERAKRKRRKTLFRLTVILLFVSGGIFIYNKWMPDTKWYSVNPRATSFNISTAKELAGLAHIVNGRAIGIARDNFSGKTIKLTRNIDLSSYARGVDLFGFINGEGWIPIGNYSADSNNVFSGTFNGGGYAINNLTINRPDADRQGLFGRIESNARIENLKLNNVNIRGRSRIGGVVGATRAGNVINSHSSGVVVGTNNIGGIVGAISGSSRVTNSNSSAMVSGDTAVGGIVGGISRGVNVVNTYSTGVVIGHHGIGGVVGSAFDSCRVIGSYFTGEIRGDGYIGGVAGQILSNSIVTNSYSTGAVSGNSVVGGVVGTVRGNSNVINSHSTGIISGNSFVGGVAGSVEVNSQAINNYSTGKVKGSRSIGGITGLARSNSIVTGNYSIGIISGDSAIGGVVGRVRENSRVSGNAALNPSVTGKGADVGRVIGSLNQSRLFNNVAFDGMLKNARTATNGTLTNTDGANITTIAIRRDGTIGGLFTVANGWTMQSGSLPGIGKTVAIPQHLQTNSALTTTRNDQNFRTVEIGNLLWMAENLNNENHARGTTSWCYNDNPTNCTRFGRLYTWAAAQSACPAGWRLPTRDDWNNNGPATDNSRFSALSGGYRVPDGRFIAGGECGYWWSATGVRDGSAYFQAKCRNSEGIESNINQSTGLSVRCVQSRGSGNLDQKRGELKVSSPDFLKGGQLTGGRSRASIQRVVMQNMAALRHAYNRRLREKPSLSGRITVRFAIDEFGKVISAQMVETTMNDPELEQIVVARVRSWNFDKVDKQGDVTEVVYPFVFSQ